MNKIRNYMLLLAVMLLSFFACRGVDAKASAPSENIDVTVFKDLEMICPEDSLYGFEELFILNNSLVPIKITTVHAEEHNGWELVPEDAEFPKDSKKVYLELDGDTVLGGENDIADYMVGAEHHAEYYPTMRHAIWTYSAPSELAFTLTFEYEIGTADFLLTLDANGGTGNTQMTLKNGTEVNLPIPEKEGYGFVGWEDEDGVLYKDTFIMPIGDTLLKAKYSEPTAYALYSEDDLSFTFVKTTEQLKVGDIYDGKTISILYKDVEEQYDFHEIPWHYDGLSGLIEKVIVKDEITPKCTAYWFYQFTHCMYFDLAKLNTSLVDNMEYMFFAVGDSAGSSPIIINGMENWDTSNVRGMAYMFHYIGWGSEKIHIGNLSGWDVSNVSSMQGMFLDCATNATELYLKGLDEWDVGNVTDFCSMFNGCGTFAEEWNVGNLGHWNVSKGITFDEMFRYAGQRSKAFYIGNLENWNTQSASSMSYMFEYTGISANWALDCSNWNVDNVIEYHWFNNGSEDKVIPPKWKN